jgi:DNA repair ATPase RecN
MQSRRLYDDEADTARREAEAALSLAVEYVGAIGQTEEPADHGEELSLDTAELERYEADIVTQLEEADARFDDGLYEDVIYDRRRDTHVMPDADRDIDEFYNALDDAYIAVAVTLDVLEQVTERTDREPLEDIDLDREYPDLDGVEAYEEHLEAVGLDGL